MRMSPHEMAFHQGFAAAAAAVAREHDQPALAFCVLKDSGITLRDLERAKVDRFDLDVLRKVYADAPGASPGKDGSEP